MPDRLDDPPASLAARAALVALCVAFVVLSARTSWVLPLFEVPDEYEHYEVAAHYARELALPNLADMPPRSLVEGVQPPLAYVGFALGMHALDLVGTDVFGRRVIDTTRARTGDVALFQHGPDEARPYTGLARALHLLRLLNLLPGLAVVLATFALARRVAPHRDGLAVGAAALVALNPQFGSLSGGVTNDVLAIALCTLALERLVAWARTPAPRDRQLLVLGAVVGAALIAKLSATFLAPTIAVALVLRRMRGETTSRVVTQGYLIAVGAVLVSGPWFAWNTITYGDPLAWELGVAKFGLDRGELTSAPTWRLLAMRYVPRMASTYAARFGATGPGGPWLEAAWTGVAACAAFGLLALASRRVRRGLVPDGHGDRYALLGAAIVANLFASVTFYLSFNQAQGRYLFPTIAPTAVVVALLCATWMRPAVATLGVALLGLTLADAQRGPLTAAFWPLNRGHDATFALGAPHASASPSDERIAWIAPATETIESPEPPRLRWVADAPDARYTVRLSTRGFASTIDVWEDFGTTAHDRFVIPREIWSRVPVGVSLSMRVQRLATPDERRAGVTPPTSPARTWRRVDGAPRDEAADRARDTLLPPPRDPTLDGVRLRVRDGEVVVDVEDGGPPGATLVCLHGEGEALDDWSAWTTSERRHLRVVTVALDHALAVDVLAARVRLALDTLGVTGAVVLGDGRGADVAVALAHLVAEELAADRAARAPGATPLPSPVTGLWLTRRTPRDAPAEIPATVFEVPRDGRPVGERVLDALGTSAR